MPHWGDGRFLRSAVESVLDQDFTNFRLSLVDDASPGDQWIDQVRDLTRDPRLRLYRTDRRVGPYRIKNRMIAESASPYIAFQDADDVSHPNRIGLQIMALEQREIDVVGCSYNVIDADGRLMGRRRMPWHANLWRRLGKSFIILHATMVTRRSSIESLGGFDGTTMVGADTDFDIRASHVLRIRNLSRHLYDYRKYDQSLTGSSDTGFRSRIRSEYMAGVFERERHRRRSGKNGLDHALLLASPNDTDFEISVVSVFG